MIEGANTTTDPPVIIQEFIMRVICNKEISKHINNITKHRISTIVFKSPEKTFY